MELFRRNDDERAAPAGGFGACRRLWWTWRIRRIALAANRRAEMAIIAGRIRRHDPHHTVDRLAYQLGWSEWEVGHMLRAMRRRGEVMEGFNPESGRHYYMAVPQMPWPAVTGTGPHEARPRPV